MAELPSGMVTFLLTDVEGSTALWEEAPDAMHVALARHDALFEGAVGEHRGIDVRPRGEGDGRFAVFASASDAVAAALAIQRAFAAESWPTPRPIRVRMGVHTGEAEQRDGDYYGSPVNRCARLRGIGHGGQILLSYATAALVRDDLPVGTGLRGLGRHRLKDLAEPERVSQVVAPDLPSDFPPLASLEARPHNLPARPTALIGRGRELAEVLGLFEGGARLVTLTGPGGTGKTRLSLQLAADLLDGFEHGVFLVELAPISDPALVPSTIAQVLGVRDVGNRPIVDALKEYLHARSLLVVLDNLEQILPAAPVVADLLASCPDLAVLATSREPLRLRGEQEYAVLPLALPDADRAATPDAVLGSPAVALFVQRARAIRPDFAVTSLNAADVAELCCRLDGLPLAIELAASHIRLLTPEAILPRLGHGLSLLTGSRRDLPTRQQTLRSTIAWSYDLLDEAEQSLFSRLSVFVGGFTLAAAEAVCCDPGQVRVDVLDRTESLLEKSLIKRDDVAGDEPRFRMLETIREYARERLVDAGEKQSTERRHAAWCIDLVERAEVGLHGTDQRVWLRQLEEEHENARVALTSSLAEADQAEVALRLAGGLAWFWFVSGRFHEGRMWLERSLLASAARTRSGHSPRRWQAKALLGGGRLAHYQGDYDRGSALLEESLALARAHLDSAGVAAASTALGHLTLDRGEYEAARRLCHEGLDLSLQRGDASAAGAARLLLGRVACAQGHSDAARLLFEQSLSSWQEARNGWGVAWALNYLGLLALDSGAVEQAESLLGESLELADALRDARGIALALVGFGEAARRRGDLATAEARIRESLLLHRDLGDRWGIAQCLDELAQIATLRPVPGLAVQLFAAARSLREAIGASLPAAQNETIDRSLADLRRALNPAAFASEWATGTTIRVEQLLAAWPSPRPPGITAEPAAFEVPHAPGRSVDATRGGGRGASRARLHEWADCRVARPLRPHGQDPRPQYPQKAWPR